MGLYDHDWFWEIVISFHGMCDIIMSTAQYTVVYSTFEHVCIYIYGSICQQHACPELLHKNWTGEDFPLQSDHKHQREISHTDKGIILCFRALETIIENTPEKPPITVYEQFIGLASWR